MLNTIRIITMISKEFIFHKLLRLTGYVSAARRHERCFKINIRLFATSVEPDQPVNKRSPVRIGKGRVKT